MPWRKDFVESFWLDPDWHGLAGYPSEGATPHAPTPEPPEKPPIETVKAIEAIEEWAPTHVNLLYPVHVQRVPTRRVVHAAVISVRDRIGFRYEREVGLDDFVSIREAAQLLRLPLMTVSRWVKKKELKSSRRHGFSVIRLREVLRMAKERKTNLILGSRLTILGQEKKL